MDTAKTLVANDKCLLAMDERNPTYYKRFAKLGIAQTEVLGAKTFKPLRI